MRLILFSQKNIFTRLIIKRRRSETLNCCVKSKSAEVLTAQFYTTAAAVAWEFYLFALDSLQFKRKKKREFLLDAKRVKLVTTAR